MVNTLDDLKKFFNGKRVFLTGHTGFKGAWLLKICHLLGAEVKGYALAPKTSGDLYCAIQGDKLCQSVIADIRDRHRLFEEMISFSPNVVFHLAAQPLVRLSYQIPAETFEINSIGTANLLDGLRQVSNACATVLITTDKVYHNHEWVYPYRENDRLGGYDPYSASKACTELVIDSYRNSFFNPHNFTSHQKGIAVARAGNVIGGGDWSVDRLIPDVARALSQNEPVALRNPQAVRPWQHVLEPLRGYLQLAIKVAQYPHQFSEAYNFGPYESDTLTVEQMATAAIKSWGGGSFQLSSVKENLHEARLLKLDISKAIAELDWRPKWNAEKAVAATIAWYKTYVDANDCIDKFTQQQIEQYFYES